MVSYKNKEELYKEASKIALNNSQRFCDEARILLDKNHYARCFALNIISLEESVKALLLRIISLDLFNEQETMYFVRNHENKLQQSSLILTSLAKFFGVMMEIAKIGHETGQIKGNLPSPNDYKDKLTGLMMLSERIANFQSRKNDSLYVDVRDDKIVDPNKMVIKEEAITMLEIANMQISVAKVLIDLDKKKLLEICKIPEVATTISKIKEEMSRYSTKRKK